jgi:alkylation response protein AidB-like acyl-CoA dehydrogenase
MDFEHSPRAQQLFGRVRAFIDEHILPVEAEFERQAAWDGRGPVPLPALLPALQAQARTAGLWNLFLPDPAHGAGLKTVEYAPLCELMGRVYWAPEVFNCNAPDTGNMELLHDYGTPAQHARWLAPLLRAEIRSAYCMTEPAVASSDATNIACEIRRDGDEYVVTGRKWWTTNALHPNLGVLIVMGKSNPEAPPHAQHSQIIVDPQARGVTIRRHLPVFGYHEVPNGHGEIDFDAVRVPADNLILGEGRGFEIAQGRLGPGRIHHCMRSIGAAERALEMMCRRLLSRRAFGKAIAEHSVWEQRIGELRQQIDMCRLYVYRTAWLMDTAGRLPSGRNWNPAVRALQWRPVSPAGPGCGLAAGNSVGRL